jgi:hypothetical protein
MKTTIGSDTWKISVLLPVVMLAGIFLILTAIGIYTGDAIFFLKWFFGLQADD